MASRTVVVLDPGHGGAAPAGGSSPNRARGPNGLLEKDLTLDIARRTERILAPSAEVQLTRSADTNLPLEDRANVARRANAALFVSLHCNGSPDPRHDGTEVFISRNAGPASRKLAGLLAEAVGGETRNSKVETRDLGVLLPDRHASETAACLVELTYLTNPERARQLESEAQRDRFAGAVARGILSYLDRVPGPMALQARAMAGSPQAWAAGKRSTGLQRFRMFGTEFIRQCNLVFPGVPPELLMGFALNGGPGENTTGFVTGDESERPPARERPPLGGVASQAFHEIGMFGVEGGPRSGPAPGLRSNWSQLAGTPEVRAILGRPGCTAPGCWHPGPMPGAGWQSMPEPVRDQTAIGLVNIARHRDNVVRQLNAAIRPTSGNSLWALALGFMGWSAGDARAARHINALATQLAGSPEATRWGIYVRLLAEGGQSGAIQAQPGPRRGVKHNSPFWSALRTLQKIEAGLVLARERQGNTAFFEDGLGAARQQVHDAITTFALHGTPSQQAPSTHALSTTPTRYTGTRTHTPSNSAALFRTAPTPVAVTPATLFPVPSTTAEADVRHALGAQGLTAAQLRTFETNGGLPGLQPFATVFGGAMLVELMARLRYTTGRIARPPHTYGRSLNQSIRVPHAEQVLAPRLLLAIPGHFRELARLTTSVPEAYALESLGWLLMTSVRDAINTATQRNWWVPPAPAWVSRFPVTLTNLSTQTSTLINGNSLTSSSVTAEQFQETCRRWQNSLAGRQWQLEIGLGASPAPGRPFYPSLVTVPPVVQTNNERAQIDAQWRRRLQATDAQHAPGSAASAAALRQCEDRWVDQLNLFQAAPLAGMQISYHFPIFVPAAGARRMPYFTSFRMLRVVQPTAAALFAAIAELGWNDLLFNNMGQTCFRGTKNSNIASARRISNHAYGLALDFMPQENGQPAQGQPTLQTIDPRIVAIFEAFRFNWGLRFQQPDPMHFEYCGTC